MKSKYQECVDLAGEIVALLQTRADRGMAQTALEIVKAALPALELPITQQSRVGEVPAAGNSLNYNLPPNHI